MKKIITIFLLTPFLIQSCENKNGLEDSFWKYCDDYGAGYISDVLDFRGNKYLLVRNDTIFDKKEVAIATIDRIEDDYGERRLFVKDQNGRLARYCEK